MAARVSETKVAEATRIATELGIPIADAKKVITDQRAAAEAAKTKEQQALDAAAERERLANERESAAAAKERSLTAKEVLLDDKIGVNPKHLARAATLLLAETATDADAAAMTIAATKLKAEMPELFGTPRIPGSDPQGRGPGQGGTGPTGVEAGKARATAAHADASKSSRNPFEGLSLIGGPAGGNHS